MMLQAVPILHWGEKQSKDQWASTHEKCTADIEIQIICKTMTFTPQIWM